MYALRFFTCRVVLLWAGVQLVLVLGLPIRNQGQVVLKTSSSLRDAHTITDALEKGGIIPDVLPDFTPKVDLKVHYLVEKKGVILPNLRLPQRLEINMGNTVAASAMVNQPRVRVVPLNKDIASSLLPKPQHPTGKTLTLVLTSLDAISASGSAKSQKCHWIAAGVGIPQHQPGPQGGDGSPVEFTLNLSNVKDAWLHDPSQTRSANLVPYMQPAIPPKAKKQRYAFVLFERKETSEGKPLTAPTQRIRWGYRRKDQGVIDWARDNDLTPIGANFFYSE